MMKSVLFDSYGGPEVLYVGEREVPAPGAGQIRIAVRAMGLNPADWKTRAGLMQDFMKLSFPACFGREASGVVDALGPGLVERVRELTDEPVDLGFDAAGQGGVPALIELTGDPKHVATIADFGAAVLGIVIVQGDFRPQEAVGLAAEMAAAGTLRMPVAEVFTFAQAAQAHIRSAQGHVRGKLVLIPE